METLWLPQDLNVLSVKGQGMFSDLFGKTVMEVTKSGCSKTPTVNCVPPQEIPLGGMTHELLLFRHTM